MASFGDRLRHAWNAFRRPRLEAVRYRGSYGHTSMRRTYISTELSVLAAVKTRIAMDCADVRIRHVRNNEYRGRLRQCRTIVHRSHRRFL